MKVDIMKVGKGLSIARHNKVVVYVSFSDNDTFQAAIDYIEDYQSKWYRRLKRFLLNLLGSFDELNCEEGIWNFDKGLDFKSGISITSCSNTQFIGKGRSTELYILEDNVKSQ